MGRGLTLCVCPVCIEVGQRGLVGDLLERLGGLVVDLQDAARASAAAGGLVVHVEICASRARGVCPGVVGDAGLEESRGSQLGGVDWENAQAAGERVSRVMPVCWRARGGDVGRFVVGGGVFVAKR